MSGSGQEWAKKSGNRWQWAANEWEWEGVDGNGQEWVEGMGVCGSRWKCVGVGGSGREHSLV